MQLQSGQNTLLSTLSITLNLRYPVCPGFKGEPDTCLFLLNAQGKVTGDADFIFYNNLSSPEGAVKLVTGSHQSSIDIALDRVPANVSKIAITVVIDGEETISGLSLLSIQAPGIAEFQVETQNRSEKAIILGEVYRHNGAWKLRALGQGFNGGLEPLAISYGVDVAQSARSKYNLLVSAWKRNSKPNHHGLSVSLKRPLSASLKINWIHWRPQLRLSLMHPVQ